MLVHRPAYWIPARLALQHIQLPKNAVAHEVRVARHPVVFRRYGGRQLDSAAPRLLDGFLQHVQTNRLLAVKVDRPRIAFGDDRRLDKRPAFFGWQSTVRARLQFHASRSFFRSRTTRFFG